MPCSSRTRVRGPNQASPASSEASEAIRRWVAKLFAGAASLPKVLYRTRARSKYAALPLVSIASLLRRSKYHYRFAAAPTFVAAALLASQLYRVRASVHASPASQAAAKLGSASQKRVHDATKGEATKVDAHCQLRKASRRARGPVGAGARSEAGSWLKQG